jgi:hypothetical protein
VIGWIAALVRGSEENDCPPSSEGTQPAIDQHRRLPTMHELEETGKGLSEVASMAKEAGLRHLFASALKLPHKD